MRDRIDEDLIQVERDLEKTFEGLKGKLNFLSQEAFLRAMASRLEEKRSPLPLSWKPVLGFALLLLLLALPIFSALKGYLHDRYIHNRYVSLDSLIEKHLLQDDLAFYDEPTYMDVVLGDPEVYLLSDNDLKELAGQSVQIIIDELDQY